MSAASKLWKCLLPDLCALGMMATIAICVGLLVNQFRDKPLSLVYQSKQVRLDQAVSRVAALEDSRPSSPSVSQELSLDEFRIFVEKKRGLILDARPELFHRLGHVPGALSLPREDFEAGYARLKSRLEADKNQPMVVYCSSNSCEDSELLQKALGGLGFTQVVVWRGGWAEWTQAGLPEEKTL